MEILDYTQDCVLCCTGNVYGNCCGGNCGGYEGGKSAIKHAKDGLFDDAPYTEWLRGEPAEVYWFASADHRGGYAYRLCKVNFSCKHT